jgi:hypothetical protein
METAAMPPNTPFNQRFAAPLPLADEEVAALLHMKMGSRTFRRGQ